jgi:hypothetical protein
MPHTFTDTLLTKLGLRLHTAQTLAAAVYRNGILTTLSVGITQLNTGAYSYAVPVPDDWLPADTVSVHFTYTINDFSPVTTKVALGSVQRLRAIDVSSEIAQQVANQAAALLIAATQEQLQALAAEIAAGKSGAATEPPTAIASGSLKKISATGHIASITGTTSL